MRKIYLTTGLIFAAGFSFAQVSHSVKENIKMKPDSQVLLPEVIVTDGAFENRVDFWTEDFANGFASSNGTWTVDGVDGSVWKHDLYGPSGCFSTNQNPTFTTKANGFMLFDADSVNCLDASTSSYTTNVLAGSLVSPTIDLSAQPSVLITYQQMLRHCCGTLTVNLYVSTDNGVNWSAPIDVLYGLATNASSGTQTVSINISTLTNSSSTVKLKFEWGGTSSHYFWAIDDIGLSVPDPNDVRLNSTVFYNETYDPIIGVPVDFFITPANQIDNVVFSGVMDNQGSATAFNANLAMSVENSATTVVATGNSTPSDLASATLRTDSVIWAHNATPETYTIEITADHDDIGLETSSTDNIKTSTIITTPASGAGSIYARDNNTATGSGLWNGAGNGYIMGQTFSIYNTATLVSIDVAFTPSTDPGVAACVILYEIDPSTGDFNPLVDNCLDGYEYVLTSNMISTSSTMVWNRFPINPASITTGYTLVPGQYIAAINHYGGAEDMVIQAGGTAPDGWSVWLFDQTDATWYYMTTKPKIRMGFDNTALFLGVEEGEMPNMSLSQNSPNPANGLTTIGYSLWESAEVNFSVVDVTGKLVYSEEIGNKVAGVYNIQLDTKNFANGVYYYTLTAGAEKMTRKMVVTE